MKQKLARLGDVAEIERDSVSPAAIREGTAYVGLEHIDGSGAIEEVKVAEGELASSKFRFSSEHVLFGKLRPYLRKIARPSFSGICSTDVIPIRPGSRIDRDYLFYVLRQDALVAKAASLATGINLPRISPKTLESFEIPLPPLEEQRRVAAILDQADELRQKRRRTLLRLEGLIWAIFYDVFGAPDVNANNYPVRRFGDLIVDGPTNGLYKHSSAYGEGTPILRINNFYDGSVVDLNELRRVKLSDDEMQAFELRKGDIVINRVNSREYLGKSALIPDLPEPVVFESNMMRIGVNKRELDGIFCISLLQTAFIKRQIDRSAKDAVNQSSINQSDVCRFQFVVPPLTHQLAFAARVTEINRLKSVCRSHLGQLDALFASLQYRAFCGEL